MTPTPNLYTPPIATTEIDTYKNVFLGIQGEAGTGKTASSLTFPNPILALLEKPDLEGIMSLPHLKEMAVPPILPFYKNEWLDQHKFPKFNAPGSNEYKHDPAGSFKTWLEGTARQITNQQTLVVDNWTRLQELFDELNWSYKTYSKKGEEDFYVPWDRKLDFSEQVMNALVSLDCNVVVLFHEVRERDKATGLITEKIQPLQKGQFIVKLKTYFPNFFRQRVRGKRDTTGAMTEDVEYLWQTKSNDSFDAKCSKPNLAQYVPANFKSLSI